MLKAGDEGLHQAEGGRTKRPTRSLAGGARCRSRRSLHRFGSSARAAVLAPGAHPRGIRREGAKGDGVEDLDGHLDEPRLLAVADPEFLDLDLGDLGLDELHDAQARWESRRAVHGG